MADPMVDPGLFAIMYSKSVPEFMRHVRKYVQCHLADLPPKGLPLVSR